MKEYIKPEVELLNYSFNDIIADGSVSLPELDIPDIVEPEF